MTFLNNHKIAISCACVVHGCDVAGSQEVHRQQKLSPETWQDGLCVARHHPSPETVEWHKRGAWRSCRQWSTARDSSVPSIRIMVRLAWHARPACLSVGWADVQLWPFCFFVGPGLWHLRSVRDSKCWPKCFSCCFLEKDVDHLMLLVMKD